MAELSSCADLIWEEVRKKFDERRQAGQLSLAHDLDHVKAVAYHASKLAEDFSRKLKLDEETVRRNSERAKIAGFAHDAERIKKEVEPHGILSARWFEELYKSGKLGITQEDFEIIKAVIQDHELSFSEITEKYAGSPVLPVAQAVVAADKLFEASGYRVLERRSFFVGRERILKGDLKDKFKHPGESWLAVLGETIRRLYQVNHVRNYPEELRQYVDELHAIQYEFYRGLLLRAGMDEKEAANYLLKRGFPKLEKAKDRLEEEGHLSRFPFKQEFPSITEAIEKEHLEDERKEGAYQLVNHFAISSSPDDAFLRAKPTGNYWFDRWMSGILNYRTKN